MNLRNFLAIKSIVFAVLICLAIFLPQILQNNEKRLQLNVVWISVDTLRAKSLKLYGNQRETTPNITEIGNQSLVFENTIAQGSVTQVSHYSMLTGFYPNKHRVLYDLKKDVLSPNIKIASEYFKENGYKTFLTGAFMPQGPLDPLRGLNRGADHIVPYDPLENLNARKDFLEVIRSVENQPIFAFVHTAMVHGPYLTRPSCNDKVETNYKGRLIWDEAGLQKAFDEQDDKKKSFGPKAFSSDDYFFTLVDPMNPLDMELLTKLYERGIKCMDRQLGIFLNEFKKSLNNNLDTILIITADHGEAMGEHRQLQHGGIYDENIKIPLIISFPKVQGMKISTPVRSIDILPTVLDFLKISHPEEMDGKSLLHLITNPQDKHFEYAFSQHKNKYAVYKDQYKFVFNKGSEELYDLKKDPKELQNIIEIKPEIAFELKTEFFKYSAASTP